MNSNAPRPPIKRAKPRWPKPHALYATFVCDRCRNLFTGACHVVEGPPGDGKYCRDCCPDCQKKHAAK